jgi:Bacterial Ig-like domain
MYKSVLKYIFVVLLLIIVGCAKRGTIDGGLKDTIAPVLKLSFPKNGTTNFTGNEIKLTFDEYVKLKDLNKQLIISPPMKRIPEILPTTASKILTIKMKDTLLPNTTYSFNFGQSIEDNNEGNPYKQFKYVFSTGSFIDSLKLNGVVKDARNKDVDHFVSVFLYEVNDKFKDSIVYKEKPRYVTNTLDSLKSFRLENVKAGKYFLVALKDKNNNYKFDPSEDKIGFQKQYITLPNDTLFQLELFKEKLPFKALKPSQASGNRILLPCEGNPKNIKIVLKNKENILETIVTKFQEKDSIQVWYKPLKVDSLQMNVVLDKYAKDFIFKIKAQKKDTLNFSAKQKFMPRFH